MRFQNVGYPHIRLISPLARGVAGSSFRKEEVMVKRERMLQVALGLLGLFYVGLIYPAVHRPSAFQVASGNERRMRADVS